METDNHIKNKRSVKKYRQQDIDKAISMGKNSFLVFIEERKANTKVKKMLGLLYHEYIQFILTGVLNTP